MKKEVCEPPKIPPKTDPVQDLFDLDGKEGETPQEKDDRRREFLEKRRKVLEAAEKERAEEEAAARGYKPLTSETGAPSGEQAAHDSPYKQVEKGGQLTSGGAVSSTSERVAISIPESSPYTAGMSKDLGEFIKEVSQKRAVDNYGQVYSTKGIHKNHLDAKSRQVAYTGSSDSIKGRNFWIMMVVFTAWISVTLLLLWEKGII